MWRRDSCEPRRVIRRAPAQRCPAPPRLLRAHWGGSRSSLACRSFLGVAVVHALVAVTMETLAVRRARLFQ